MSKLASTPATLTGTEILTNKTLTSPVLNGTVTGSAVNATPTANNIPVLDANALLAVAAVPGRRTAALASLSNGVTSGTLITLDSGDVVMAVIRSPGGNTHGQTTAIIAFLDSADKVVTPLSNQGYQWNGTFNIGSTGIITFTNNGAEATTSLVFTFTMLNM